MCESFSFLINGLKKLPMILWIPQIKEGVFILRADSSRLWLFSKSHQDEAEKAELVVVDGLCLLLTIYTTTTIFS